jgi:CP family cyanate transporter-like MFS transporter
LLPGIQSDLQISSSLAGLIVSMPVLLVGMGAAVGGWLPRSLRPRQVIAVSMLGACVGILIRSAAGVAPHGLYYFFLGTLVLGTCLGMANAIVPVLIKPLQPSEQVTAAGVVNCALCLGGALAAGLSQPAASLLSNRWDAALALWCIPALACALACSMLHDEARPSDAGGRKRNAISLHPIAIGLGLNMALQSFLSQATSTWLPTILISHGSTRQESGALLATLMVAQLLTALTGAWIATRKADQGNVVTAMYLLGLVGFIGCTQLGAPWNWIGAVLLGLGQGGTFSVALHLVVLRSRDAASATALAATTLIMGYTLSATAPWLFGTLRDFTGSWSFALPLFGFATLLGICAGRFAGRARLLPATGPLLHLKE